MSESIGAPPPELFQPPPEGTLPQAQDIFNYYRPTTESRLSRPTITSVNPEYFDAFSQTHDAFKGHLANHEALQGGKVMSIQLTEHGVLEGVVKIGKNIVVVRKDAVGHIVNGESDVTIHETEQKHKSFGLLGVAVNEPEGGETRYLLNRRRNKDFVSIERWKDPADERSIEAVGSTALKQVMIQSKGRIRAPEYASLRMQNAASRSTADLRGASTTPIRSETTINTAPQSNEQAEVSEILERDRDNLTPEDFSKLTELGFQAVHNIDPRRVEELKDANGRVYGRVMRIPIDNGAGVMHRGIIIERAIPGSNGKTIDLIFQDKRTGADYGGTSMRVTDLHGDGRGSINGLTRMPSGEYWAKHGQASPFWTETWARNLAKVIEQNSKQHLRPTTPKVGLVHKPPFNKPLEEEEPPLTVQDMPHPRQTEHVTPRDVGNQRPRRRRREEYGVVRSKRLPGQNSVDGRYARRPSTTRGRPTVQNRPDSNAASRVSGQSNVEPLSGAGIAPEGIDGRNISADEQRMFMEMIGDKGNGLTDETVTPRDSRRQTREPRTNPSDGRMGRRERYGEARRSGRYGRG